MDSGATISSETSSAKKGKKFVTEDVDFISKLPDELLHEILSYVSLRESVRTSILSHRWRYVSAFKPSLRFNWQEMFIREGANSEFWKAHYRPCMTFTGMITGAISNYTRFYKGEKIDLFEVNFCFCNYIVNHTVSHNFVEYSAQYDIDGWIKFALGKGVESLTLFNQCEFVCCKGCKKYGNEFVCGFNYVFRTELFDGIAVNLKHLTLRSCRFGPNFTNQLSSLQTISLHNVDCLATNLESMFPFLEKLETLEITSCVLPKKLSLQPLHRLQRFILHSPGLVEEIEVHNADLVEFKCSDIVRCDLSGAPHLISLNYTVPFGEIELVFTDRPLLNPDLRVLTLRILDDWVNWVPPRSVWTPSQVTHVYVHFNGGSDFSLVRAIAFLKAFPLLRHLLLLVRWTRDLEEEEPELSYVPKHLTEINIPRFYYTPKQMQFAIYLLENASALEKMSVGSIRPFGVEGKHHVLHSKLQEMDKRKILV